MQFPENGKGRGKLGFRRGTRNGKEVEGGGGKGGGE